MLHQNNRRHRHTRLAATRSPRQCREGTSPRTACDVNKGLPVQAGSNIRPGADTEEIPNDNIWRCSQVKSHGLAANTPVIRPKNRIPAIDGAPPDLLNDRLPGVPSALPGTHGAEPRIRITIVFPFLIIARHLAVVLANKQGQRHWLPSTGRNWHTPLSLTQWETLMETASIRSLTVIATVTVRS